MTTLLPLTELPTAEDLLLETLTAIDSAAGRSAQHEFWLFTDRHRCRQLERALAADGWKVRVHSAFKPLVSSLLDWHEKSGGVTVAAVTVECPTHPVAAERRFQLEAYPLGKLVQLWWPGASVRFTERPVTDAADLWYEVTITPSEGTSDHLRVFAPNRLMRSAGREVLTPCGWWRMTMADGSLVRDEPWETPYELLYQLVLDAVTGHPWKQPGPHFEQMRVAINHDGAQERLPVGHDRLDTAEALHEELYFSLLERFTLLAGKPVGTRGVQPGQIVPVIRNTPGARASVEVTLRKCRFDLAAGGGKVLNSAELASLQAGPSAEDIAATISSLPGEHLTATTARGLSVHGVYRPGTRPGVVINGGQHANENSGIVGALRAALELLREPETNVGVIALENPEGYALHKELCQVHGEHMHHAARYTALGDDLSDRSSEQPFESAVRRSLLERTNAELLVNLHGYPAHEWVRPLTGYLPRGFEWWALPQGFILMARCQPGFTTLAEQLLRSVARELQQRLPALVVFNRDLLASYELHAGKLMFPLEGAIPIAISETNQSGPAVELISEYPDETVSGAAFLLAHDTQYLTAITAAREWWQLVEGDMLRT